MCLICCAGTERRIFQNSTSASNSSLGPQAPHEDGATLTDNWKAWFTRSGLCFACPQLEEEYQQYQAHSLNTLTCIWMLIRVCGYGMFFAMIYKQGVAYRHVLPPLAWPVLAHLVPGIVILALLSFFPSFSTTHYLAVHFASNVSLWCTYHQMRQLLLWMGLVDATNNPSFLHHIRTFSKENIYLCTTWYMLSADPWGRLSVMGLLAVNLAGNSAICASPLWPQGTVTMSPGPLAAVKAISGALLETAEPFYNARHRSVMSCPAVLAVWQILGSLLALLMRGGTEIARRRAFLRKQEVQARLGPDRAAEALHWPWGGPFLTSKCVSMALGLFVVHVVLLALIADATL